MKASVPFPMSLVMVVIILRLSGYECHAFSVPSYQMKALDSFAKRKHSLVSTSTSVAITKATNLRTTIMATTKTTALGAVPPVTSWIALPSAKTIATTTILPTSIGLYKYEYAVSYAYGTATALTSYLVYKALLPLTETTVFHQWSKIHALATVFYGIRLNIFLLFREVCIPRFRHMRERIEERRNAKDGSDGSFISNLIARTPFILSCALLYAGLIMPPYSSGMLFHLGMIPTVECSSVALHIYKALVSMTWLGFSIGALGDLNKTLVKAYKGADHLVTSGIFKFLRHPNYTGEVIGWTSSFLASIVAVIAAIKQFGIASLSKETIFLKLVLPHSLGLMGFIGIVFVLCAATLNLEKRQEEKYSELEEYREWIKTSWKGFSLRAFVVVPTVEIRSNKQRKVVPGSLARKITINGDKTIHTRKLRSSLMLTSDVAADFSSRGSMIVAHTQHLLGVDTGIPLLNQILINPSFWSICVMLTIVSLLYTWEETIHTLRHILPKPLLPVLESLLGEIAGLGFIGLVLEIFITSNPDRGIGSIISNLSYLFLGENELLIEAFEFLHDSFFQVGVGFFFIMGSIVYMVLKRISELSKISDLAIDTDGDGEVTLEELATALNVPLIIVDADGDGHLTDEEITNALRNTGSRNFVQELFLTQEERAAEKLVLRENFIMNNNLNDDFLIERYFEFIYAHQLEEMVELSPIVWVPLIPLIALLNSVDLSREIVSASSDNAALSSGCFITASWFMVPFVASQVICLSWGIFNFWKMKKVKNMLIPTLVRDGANGEAILLPPRYMDEELRLELNTSPGPVAFIEHALGGKPCTNDHEFLFGAAGQEGPEIYKKSIKYHTWLCVSCLVFIFNEIVVRDFFTWIDYNKGLIDVKDIGDVTWVVPELQLFSAFVMSLVLQLLVSPIVFLNYSTAVSVEKLTQSWALEQAKEASSSSKDS